MTAIEHEHIEVPVDDGTKVDLYVARPTDEHDRQAGLLVFQEIFGVNAHIRDVCARFARLGYTAVAPDMFHRTAPLFEAAYTDFSGRQHAQATSGEQRSADIRAAHGWVHKLLCDRTDDVSIGAIGFCMGGGLAFRANATVPLKAAVSFYGGAMSNELVELAPAQHGRLLLVWGGKDPMITVDRRRASEDALSAADKTFTSIVFSDAQHGFFCDVRGSYDEIAAKESWALVTQFLAHHLG